MNEAEFRKALYYAVREGFNCDATHDPQHIDLRWDGLIREAIAYFEQTPEEDIPDMCLVEIEGLADCARRRMT